MAFNGRSRKVADIRLEECGNLWDLTEQMYASGGFTAKKIGEAVRILEKMVNDDAYVFLSFPADIISTGARGIIRDLVKRKLVSAIITTCGTLDHDLARSWKPYYHGDFLLDDASLRKRKINRLGNILIPDSSYGLILENKLMPFLKKMYDSGARKLATYELTDRLGE